MPAKRTHSAPNPTDHFRWNEKNIWHKEVLDLLGDLICKRVIAEFRKDPPLYIVSDNLSWLDRIVERVQRKRGVGMKEIVMERLQKRYSAIVAFHGCRPVSLESYKTRGVLICDPEGLQAQAREMFGQSDRLERAIKELQNDGSFSYEKHNQGKVFFCLTMEELVNDCGHYLLYGSEYLQALAVRIGAKRVLRERGIATVIECCIPSLMMPEAYWECLAGEAIADIFETLADRDYEARTLSFGFPIYGSIPPEMILRFHHPTGIKNQDTMRRED